MFVRLPALTCAPNPVDGRVKPGHDDKKNDRMNRVLC